MNVDLITLINQLAGLVLQLVILGIIGGAITWYYSLLQKNRELRIQVLQEFAKLHGRFISLRYEFNSFYVAWKGKRSAEFHPLTDEEIRLERWKYFQQACVLIGEFQGLKPLIVATFPKCADDIEFIQSKYQDWRRHAGADSPILQHTDGKNEEAYNQLRDRYTRVIKQMRKGI